MCSRRCSKVLPSSGCSGFGLGWVCIILALIVSSSGLQIGADQRGTRKNLVLGDAVAVAPIAGLWRGGADVPALPQHGLAALPLPRGDVAAAASRRRRWTRAHATPSRRTSRQQSSRHRCAVVVLQRSPHKVLGWMSLFSRIRPALVDTTWIFWSNAGQIRSRFGRLRKIIRHISARCRANSNLGPTLGRLDVSS